MKKETKKKISTLIKRTVFLFSVAFLIYSCDNDDLEFECPIWELNIGDACADGTNIDGNMMVSGYLDANCTCISFTDSTSNSYECPIWELNIGDACADGTNIDGTMIVSGYLDANCNCISSTDTTSNSYECPDLMLNIGDSCGLNFIIDSNCECIFNNGMYDCPDLMQNFGDSCWVLNTDSTALVGGIIDLNCVCN